MSERWREQTDTMWHKSVRNLQHDYEESTDIIDTLIEKLWSGALPSIVEVSYIIERSVSILKQEPNVLKIDPPFTISGDIHGQFNDFKQMFFLAGLPPYTRFLFLGDYVDRGDKGMEVFLILCLFKIKYPENFYLIRGNHESINITRIYGFYQEILVKYHSENVYNLFGKLFEALPIAALIGNQIFCVHGGITQYCPTIEDIQKLDRFSEIPITGALNDLLWADPSLDSAGFTDSERNAGHRFGSAATDKFCHQNNVKLIIRAHQMMMDGCKYCHNDKVLTIFSAPNYEGISQNKGGFAICDENLNIELVKYAAAPPESDNDRLSNLVF
ncbi:Ser/Thr protein phosphatase, putative [Trichomonas vaginalis G3]|uniref:Serine/threonine-protein phosphatase n=1 Tax=Trichomonas vaginalis (strain ATCC PRA-98 / G3) TaxID=412133 RepID=A2DUG4_TRIV3|nr:serine threonine-protein phosphatase family [Trichomonas vaginalis G3]EAY16002.1 Ser/Thr protein phosphatase, putative [Trichomonas vaginalis G3]KAI5523557.1 serine threonine-protein phosphatase family [Trichomonas vaginalis G3]|eukprot:XP_001328225.1 Ser/Thr protein phosphatase [Trichomonas vaginalis G3]